MPVDSRELARAAIAHCLLMGLGMYPTPEDWADAALKRLTHQGLAVVRIEPPDPCECGFSNCDECGPVAQAQHESEIGQIDRWAGMTDRERDDEIRRAL